MRLTPSLLPLIICGAATAWAQTPTIRATDGVLNAASYSFSGLPNGGIAQGSIFVVFGDNLGPAKLVQVSTYPLPTTAGLAGTSITVTVGGTTVNAIMLYTLKTQVAAVLPSGTPLGTGTVRVTYNGQTSNTAPIRVVDRSFGVFSLNQGGSGPGVIQNVNSSTDLPVNSFNHPARPGQAMILWGTGIGPVSGDEAGGALPGDMTSVNIHVTVGGQDAPIQYRGRSGCCVGLDQIVFTVPSGVEGCYVPVSIVTNNVVSNFTTIAIASTGDVCSDPNGYSTSQMQTLLSGQSVRIASLVVQRIFDRNMVTTGVGAGGAPYRSDYIAAVYLTYNSSLFLTGAGQPPVGSCAVTQFPRTATLPSGYLGAGTLSVSGPVGNRTVPLSSTGVYQLVFSPTSPAATNIVADGTLITAGTYTLSATAGTAVGAHTLSLNHPATFTWSEFASFPKTIDRSQPLTITWTGGKAGALVNIHGQSAYGSGTQGDIGASFQCTADASAGSFTIPASVLSALPVTYSSASGSAHGSFDVSQYIFGPPPNIPGIDIATVSVADFFEIFATSYR